ncbi:MAG: glycosyltransferase family 2 protein [Pseudorhodoplanes sp.]|jgi:glycosyltransferase involved in cell wall biosynthesis|nr:glycosyltransferase family 2 protein [Pseudorhodoplanes sp.]
MLPRVSLALPVYNGEKFIGDAIRSILDQDYKDFELIITDNASTDGTGRICAEFAQSDGRIRYVRNERNLGAGPNFNRGFDLSSGEFFKWCACDDCLSPDFIGACVRALEMDQDAVLAYGMTRSIDEDGRLIPLVGSMMTDMGDDTPPRRFRKVIAEVGTCYEVFGVFRREALKKSALHRFYYGSDRALIAEMALLGRFLHVPDVVFYNREHANRSINIVDKKARVFWHNTDAKSTRALEHWKLLKQLIETAVRHRQVVPLSKTLPSLFAWATTPLQLSRYALEVIGLVVPSAQGWLRQMGWSVLQTLRKTG